MTNMRNSIKILATLILTMLLFVSCKKEAGFGGLSTVTGKVYAKDYKANDPLIIEAEGYTANMKIVISVDGSGKVLKETRTDNTGSFKFEELRKGSYNIWTFSDCDLCTNNDSVVVQSFEITSRKETVELDDFNIIL